MLLGQNSSLVEESDGQGKMDSRECLILTRKVFEFMEKSVS